MLRRREPASTRSSGLPSSPHHPLPAVAHLSWAPWLLLALPFPLSAGSVSSGTALDRFAAPSAVRAKMALFGTGDRSKKHKADRPWVLCLVFASRSAPPANARSARSADLSNSCCSEVVCHSRGQGGQRELEQPPRREELCHKLYFTC